MITQAWAVDGLVKAGLMALVVYAAQGGSSERELVAQQQALADRVAAIRRADYAGERDELRRLAAPLDEVKAPALAPFREYWAGFALWRRAINGFNDKAPAEEQRADLEGAVAAFQRALQARPGWIEPKVGMAGCWASLGYMAQGDPDRRRATLAELLPLMRDLEEQGADNPRALWLVGGKQLWAPPAAGGDPGKAAATHRRALAAARAEALGSEDQPVWVPAWGAPENLMSLAFIYGTTPIANRELARAYAEGALAVVPQWHYVRDILLPQVSQ